jgi:hypothetical protein
MDITPAHTSSPAAGCHPTWAIVVTAAVVAVAAAAVDAEAQARHGGGSVEPDRPFETVWVIDRGMAELEVWQSLVAVTSSETFQPVVLHSGEEPSWTTSLERLLELLPPGDSVWVSDRGTSFNVDAVATPDELTGRDGATGPVVFSADPSLDDVAALIAMRVDGRLVAEPPGASGPAVLVGVDDPQALDTVNVHLATRGAALAFANSLAERRVVMVVRAGAMRPEYVLWAFQRGARVLEVALSQQYDIYNPWSELSAVDEVDRQIDAALPGLVGNDRPEALVIAGDWHEIPFRLAHGLGDPGSPGTCPRCDNGVYEFAADLVYANLDHDDWGDPDVPVGRLMSPFADLLAIQCVVGIWSEHGAFRRPTDGIFLGLLGTAAPERQAVVAAWWAAFPGQLWSAIGPDELERAYHLDRDAFFAVADRATVVVAQAHGHPDFLSPDGDPFNQALTGVQLRQRAASGQPSFWFLHACATGKPDRRDSVAEQTLLVGLQSRLAQGALMAVENVASGSADPFWWGDGVLEPGLPVGELVRRYVSAGIAAYRDGGEVAPGLPSSDGSDAAKRFNSRGAMMWVGDPLTPVGGNV